MLPIFLAALATGVPHLDEPNKEAYNCYSTDSYLIYNKNIKSITVSLVKLAGESCDIPSQVTAELTLSKLSDVLQVKVDNFSYEKTTQITFSDVDDFSNEELAFLHIYSYESITEVDIFLFYEEKSSLEECFSEIGIILETSEMMITFMSTRKCMQEMTQTATSNLTSAILTINSVEFSIPPADVMAKYAAATAATPRFDIIITENNVALLEEAILNGQFEFTTVEDGTSIEFFAEVTSIVAGKEGYCDIFGPNINVVVQSGGYIIYPDFQACSIPGTNLIVSRLTLIGNNSIYELIETTSSGELDATRFIEFNCHEMEKDEIEMCLSFYQLDNLEFVFDVQFYNQQNFITTQRAAPRRLGRLIKRVYGKMLERTSQYCVVVEFSQEFNQTIKSMGVAAFLGAKKEFFASFTVSPNRTEYCFNCKEKCPPDSEQAIVNLGGDELAAYVSSNRRVDYGTVKIVSFVVGMAFLITTLVLAVLGFYMVMKAVKMQRKQRKGHKTE